MGRFRSISTGSAVAASLLLLTACGAPAGSEDEDASAPATVTVTAAPTENSPAASSTASSSRSASPTDDASTSSASPTETADDTPARGASSSPTDGAVLSEDIKGQNLTLSEFFQPGDYWAENRYDVADENSISGIAREISECGAGYSGPARLELRLANNFDKLSFKAGQANQSESSRDTLVVRVVGNGNQIDIQRIPFNEVQDFDLDVADVNALEIEFYLDDEVSECGASGDSTAVIWDVELQ